MTTLIIHPEFQVQRRNALELAGNLLETELDTKLSTIPPDLHLLDGTIVTSIGIDQVRELLHKLQFHPYESPHQVGVILMANMLTEEAQNSLLKTLEEPTPKTEFILTTPHEKFMLPTIISRSQKMYVKETIHARATQDEELSEGESAIPITDFYDKDLVDKFIFVEQLVADDKEYPGSIARFLGELVSDYREKLIHATKQKNLTETKALSSDIRRINKAAHFISKNANKRLTLENLILQLEKSIIQRRG